MSAKKERPARKVRGSSIKEYQKSVREQMRKKRVAYRNE